MYVSRVRFGLMYLYLKRKHAEHAYISYVDKQGRVQTESEHNTSPKFTNDMYTPSVKEMNKK